MILLLIVQKLRLLHILCIIEMTFEIVFYVAQRFIPMEYEL